MFSRKLHLLSAAEHDAARQEVPHKSKNIHSLPRRSEPHREPPFLWQIRSAASCHRLAARICMRNRMAKAFAAEREYSAKPYLWCCQCPVAGRSFPRNDNEPLLRRRRRIQRGGAHGWSERGNQEEHVAETAVGTPAQSSQGPFRSCKESLRKRIAAPREEEREGTHAELCNSVA